MVNFMPLVILGLLSAIIWQTVLQDLLFTTLGVFRDLQPIADFPFQCRRIADDPLLRACEDMWLSQDSRQLFLACSRPEGRSHWAPNIGRLNASGRHLDDAVIAMDIDSPPTASGSYPYRRLSLPNFGPVSSDGRLHVVSISGADSSETKSGKIQLYFVNAQPSVDPVTKELLDNTKTGPNATIEMFEAVGDSPQTTELRHVRTFKDRRIATPNNVAIVGEGEFYFTNDHGLYYNWLLYHASPLAGTGDVTYHGPKGSQQAHWGMRFPNGLVYGHDGLIYVPSVIDGGITVFQIQPDKSLKEISQIPIPCPLDNLSVSSNGTIYAAGIPKAQTFMAGFDDPLRARSPARVYRIVKNATEFARDPKSPAAWQVDKVLDDRDAEVLPAATVAVHDPKTGRIFLSGMYAPFIAVCEPKA